MTRIEKFAAAGLQGVLAARTNLDVAGEIETAWQYADGMEAEAVRRERAGDHDPAAAIAAPCDDVEAVELVASERYAAVLTGGLDAAEAGDAFTERETAALGATIGNFGRAVSVSEDREYLRCELSGFQCWCRTYSFRVDVREGGE